MAVAAATASFQSYKMLCSSYGSYYASRSTHYEYLTSPTPLLIFMAMNVITGFMVCNDIDITYTHKHILLYQRAHTAHAHTLTHTYTLTHTHTPQGASVTEHPLEEIWIEHMPWEGMFHSIQNM